MASKQPVLGGQGLNLLLRPRPKQDITGRKGKKEVITPRSPDTLVYLTRCEDCEFTLQNSAVKIILEQCSNMIIHVNSRLISGLIEVISSAGVTIDIQDDVQVPTITADNVRNLDIKIARKDQFQSIYSMYCTDLVLHVLEDDVIRHDINPPSNEPVSEQYITHWKERDGEKQLMTEKVERIALYPTTGEGKAEHERNRERIERRMEEFLSKMIHPKPDDTKN